MLYPSRRGSFIFCLVLFLCVAASALAQSAPLTFDTDRDGFSDEFEQAVLGSAGGTRFLMVQLRALNIPAQLWIQLTTMPLPPWEKRPRAPEGR